MEKQARLSRAQVIARLREHAAKHGFASTASLDARDKIVLRSIPLHFGGLAAARHVAGVSGPPYQKPKRKTGPKRGSRPSHARASTWSHKRVLDELRRLQRTGHSTTWQDLMSAGHATLISAANVHVGGLQRARKAAGIPTPKRRSVAKNTWTKEMVVATIRRRHRSGQPLAMTRVPQGLYNAARRHYGKWADALAVVGIDAKDVRLTIKKYTKDVIIERLRDAAGAGSDLRASSLAPVLDLKAVGREFGTLEAAIRAAGLVEHLQQRRHGGAKWNRERLVETLRERAADGIYTFTPGLRRVAQVYFGGADEARVAAGTPDPVEVRIEARRHARNDRTRARSTRRARTTWSRERVIDELRDRAKRGHHAMTSALYRASRTYFGGARQARTAAGVPDPIDLRIEERRRAETAFAARHRRRSKRRPS